MNSVLGIDGGDSSQYSLKGTESICGLFCDIDRDGGSPRRGVLPVSIRNWRKSTERRRWHNRIDTYSLLALLVFLLPPTSVPSVFLSDVEKYREPDERRSQ